MTTRDERRAQKARNVERWRRYWRVIGGSPEWLAATVRRSASHGTLCSCRQCGNPRRWFGDVTMQERRADDAMRAAQLAGE